MYGIYNSDTLTDFIDTVHRMQNFPTWNEKTFAGNYKTGWNCIVITKVYITML